MDGYYDLLGMTDRSIYYEELQRQPLFARFQAPAGSSGWTPVATPSSFACPTTIRRRNTSLRQPSRNRSLRPSERGLGYIRVKGITVEHSGDPFPMPQSGMVATSSGNWIIEDNTF